MQEAKTVKLKTYYLKKTVNRKEIKQEKKILDFSDFCTWAYNSLYLEDTCPLI